MTEIEWANMKAHELRKLASQDAVVVLPIAALEQHGPHLPVQVDSRLAGEVSRRAARLAAKKVPIAVLPTVWHGLSHHHIPFGGTITLDTEVFAGVLRCVAKSLKAQGFRRLFILNGHGGNIAASQVIAGDLAMELGMTVVASTYWVPAAEAIRKILERQRNVRHACEAETSMMLALVPHLVDKKALGKLKDGDHPGHSALLAKGAYRWLSFASRTSNGVIGDPTLASAKKGRKLLDAAAKAVAELIVAPETWKPAEDLRRAATGGVKLKDAKPGNGAARYRPARGGNGRARASDRALL